MPSGKLTSQLWPKKLVPTIAQVHWDALIYASHISSICRRPSGSGLIEYKTRANTHVCAVWIGVQRVIECRYLPSPSPHSTSTPIHPLHLFQSVLHVLLGTSHLSGMLVHVGDRLMVHIYMTCSRQLQAPHSTYRWQLLLPVLQ